LILGQADGPLKTEIPEKCHLIDLRTGHASRSLLTLMNYLKEEKPNTILSSQTHLNIIAIIARIFSGSHARLILSEHVTIGNSSRNSSHRLDRLYPILAHLFYPLAEKIVLVSHETARDFINTTHLPPKMVKVIYNPIVSRKLLDDSKIIPDHKWFKMADTQVILAAGRLTAQKNFETLINAFLLVQKSRPSARLLILGEGEDRQHLEQLAKELGLQEVVHFQGFMINPYAFMANSDLFVLCSRWEGFGNVLVEAMACGTPVVSTDCPSGPAEILANGKYGELVPVGNAELLAKAIIRTLENPTNRNTLIQRAMDFSIDKILPQYLEIMFPENGQAV
jgi:glycosyltransferase involved in cell wall biosynthesis